MSILHSPGGKGSVKVGQNFISTVISYNITPCQSEPPSFGASNSKVGTLRAAGPKSWSGDITYSGTALQLFPGKRYEDVSFYSGPNTSSGETGIIRSGDILISGANATIDIGTGQHIQWQVQFNGDGALTESTGTQIDNTDPVVVTATGATCTVTKNGSTAVTTTDWRLSNLEISITGAVSGGIATTGSEGWKRYTTGLIDFTYNLTFQNDDVDDLGFDVGDELKIVLTLSNGSTMEFSWIHIQEISAIAVDNNSPEPLSCQIMGSMQAYNQASDTYGEIKIGGTTYWPDATLSPGL